MSLEQELRRALRRTDPPAGFDDRVLSRIASGGAPNAAPALGCLGDTVRLEAPQRRWARAALPLAASFAIAFGATYYMEQQRQRHAREAQAQTEQAARDVVLALQIASAKVAAVQIKVQEMTHHEHQNAY